MKKHEVGVNLTQENLEQMKYIFSLFQNEKLRYDWNDQLERSGGKRYFHLNDTYWCVGFQEWKQLVTPSQLLKILQEEQTQNMPSSLVIGEWYKLKRGAIVNYQGKSSLTNHSNGYGAEGTGEWYNNNSWRFENPIKAAEKEVTDMLRKEAEKRYGKYWENVKIENHATKIGDNINDGNFGVSINKSTIWNKNGLIFSKGNWAEVLPQTKLTKGQWYRKNGKKKEGWEGSVLIFKFSGVYHEGCNIGFNWTGQFDKGIFVYDDDRLDEYTEMTDKEVLNKLYKYGLKQGWSRRAIADFVSQYV